MYRDPRFEVDTCNHPPVLHLKLLHCYMSITPQQNWGEGRLFTGFVLEMRDPFKFSQTERCQLWAHRKVPIPDGMAQVIYQAPCPRWGTAGVREVMLLFMGPRASAQGSRGWPSFCR